MTVQPQPLVLYVDSNPVGAQAFRRSAREWPIRLKLAADAADAASVFHAEPVTLVIAEQELTGEISGLCFLATVKALHPGTGVILYTGCTSYGDWNVDVPVLFRPCAEEELRRAVLSAVGLEVAADGTSSS